MERLSSPILGAAKKNSCTLYLLTLNEHTEHDALSLPHRLVSEQVQASFAGCKLPAVSYPTPCVLLRERRLLVK